VDFCNDLRHFFFIRYIKVPVFRDATAIPDLPGDLLPVFVTEIGKGHLRSLLG
jgi:hypothetical protein